MKQIDSVYADISVSTVENGDEEVSGIEYSRIGGARVKQRFATGRAAINASSEDEVKSKLKEAVAGNEALDAIATRNRNIRSITTKLEDTTNTQDELKGFIEELLDKKIYNSVRDWAGDNTTKQLNLLTDEDLNRVVNEFIDSDGDNG